jgi:hypothetical protein
MGSFRAEGVTRRVGSLCPPTLSVTRHIVGAGCPPYNKLATHSMLLLPGTLPADRATLKALCAGLAAHSGVATMLRSTAVEPFSGSWGDAEREAFALPSSSRQAIATPLHAALGLTDLTPIDPAKIQLIDDESRALCEAADAHLSVEGVRLVFVNANLWTVTCPREINALTERPEWLIGEPLRPNLPRGNDARLLERWMNELQMLLFAHPVNAAREERGLPPINVVWLWGFGTHNSSNEISVVGAALPRPTSDIRGVGRGNAAPTENLTHVLHLHALRNGNIPAWQTAWQILSTEILAADSIILGDSRPRLRLTPRKASAAAKFAALFQRKPTLAAVLAALQEKL